MDRVRFFSRAGFHRMLEGTPRHPARRSIRIALAVLIILNVLAVMAESVEEVRAEFSAAFYFFELVSVALFTVEYLLRIWVCVEDPRYSGRWGRLRFATTPLALVDLVAIAPFYFGALVRVDTRMLRALRLLRVLKLSRHSSSMDLLLTVIRQELSSVGSALFIMVIVVILAASGIYAIEREANPEAFDSIPKAMWWATVTLTTVGYGDVVPQTVLGKVFGVIITLAGVGMVALPAGILASGFSMELQRRREAFRLEVKRAMADGGVSIAEKERLEDEREDLGISETDARMLIRTERESRPAGVDACPHCNKPLAG